MALLIYHITTQSLWGEAKRLDRYSPASLDQEGFIHASTATQLAIIANQFYQGQKGLLVLVCDPKKLRSSVRFEDPSPPVPGLSAEEKFPHIYGPISPTEVEDVLELIPNSDGLFAFPGGLK
jgi:uncharacterized protein (DUF952 family)